MVVLLAGGIGLVLMGLLALGFGIQDKEFEVGKTLILVGTMVSCTGFLVLGLLVAVRELKTALGMAALRAPARGLRDVDVAAAEESQDETQEDSGGFPFAHRESAHRESVASPPRPLAADAPWQQEVEARRTVERPAAVTPAPAVPEVPAADPAEPKPRRNLLFSSTSRRERERAAGKTEEGTDAPPPPFAEQAPAPRAPIPEPPPATFDDAWPQPERATPRRPNRTPSTYEPPAAATPVTVLKSGVVDGMAYSLYSDGSIEAQLEEGMMRFGSIDELRTHLDQRA